MPSLSLLESFSMTAREGSFSGAARRLGVSSSAVGKAVQRLEDDLGVRLFQRTTRQLELTEEGHILLSGLTPALDALDEAIEAVRDRSETVSGHLILTAPLVGYAFLTEPLGSFQDSHPAVTLEIRYTDAVVDLIGEGIDLGIRNGPLRDSALRQTRLRGYRHGLFASPGYIDRCGTPTRDTLDAHARIAFSYAMSGQLQPWLDADGTPLPLSMPRIIVTAIEAARNAAIAGQGVAWLPDFLVDQDRAAGRLIRVLDKQVSEDGAFYLVRPAARAVPRRLQALIDHLLSGPS